MNDKLKELMKLVADNPEMEVKFLVNNILRGGYGDYKLEKISKIRKLICWLMDGDKLVVGENVIKEELGYEYNWNKINININKKYNELKKSGEIKEAIIVYLGV
jgi:hypothetical protein